MTDSFSDPLLRQRLESVGPCAVVFIGSGVQHIDKVAARQDVYCKTLDDVMDDSVRTKLALAVQRTSHERTASANDASAITQACRSVVGVLQFDGDTHNLDPQLGLAIRLFPEQLLVHCSAPAIGDERFFAFGFRRLNRSVSQSMSLADSRWYEYQMSRYKDVPDWLNARFWANPDRFGAWDNPDLYSDEEE